MLGSVKIPGVSVGEGSQSSSVGEDTAHPEGGKIDSGMNAIGWEWAQSVECMANESRSGLWRSERNEQPDYFLLCTFIDD